MGTICGERWERSVSLLSRLFITGYPSAAGRSLSDAAGRAGNKRDQGAHLGELGLAYMELGEIGRAIEYGEQALNISRKIADRHNEGVWIDPTGGHLWLIGATGDSYCVL